jgi:hypothetical protein
VLWPSVPTPQLVRSVELRLTVPGALARPAGRHMDPSSVSTSRSPSARMPARAGEMVDQIAVSRAHQPVNRSNSSAELGGRWRPEPGGPASDSATHVPRRSPATSLTWSGTASIIVRPGGGRGGGSASQVRCASTAARTRPRHGRRRGARARALPRDDGPCPCPCPAVAFRGFFGHHSSARAAACPRPRALGRWQVV